MSFKLLFPLLVSSILILGLVPSNAYADRTIGNLKCDSGYSPTFLLETTDSYVAICTNKSDQYFISEGKTTGTGVRINHVIQEGNNILAVNNGVTYVINCSGQKLENSKGNVISTSPVISCWKS